MDKDLSSRAVGCLIFIIGALLFCGYVVIFKR